MPFITVDEERNYVLHYEDSGPPNRGLNGHTADLSANSSCYTTIVFVHGIGYQGAIFNRLVPFASSRSLRLVFLSRRDYPGSSCYSDEELAQIQSTNDAEAQLAFARARASEFTTFVKKYVEQEDIPPASEDGQTGGIALISWSAAAIYTIPLLAHADSVSDETRKAIEPYLRSFVLFDVPHYTVGPEKDPAMLGNGILQDPSLALEQKIEKIGVWLASYYSHASTTSHNFQDLQLDPDPDSRTPTTIAMSKEEHDSVRYSDAMQRAEIPAQAIPRTTYRERVRRAFFDDELAKTWPRCIIAVVWAECSTWSMIHAAWQFQELKREADEAGIAGRPMKIVSMPEANHFAAWERPEETIDCFARILGSQES